MGWDGMGCVASLATLKLGVLIVRDGDGGVVGDSFVVVEGWASMRRRYEHVVPGELARGLKFTLIMGGVWIMGGEFTLGVWEVKIFKYLQNDVESRPFR